MMRPASACDVSRVIIWSGELVGVCNAISGLPFTAMYHSSNACLPARRIPLSSDVPFRASDELEAEHKFQHQREGSWPSIKSVPCLSAGRAHRVPLNLSERSPLPFTARSCALCWRVVSATRPCPERSPGAVGLQNDGLS